MSFIYPPTLPRFFLLSLSTFIDSFSAWQRSLLFLLMNFYADQRCPYTPIFHTTRVGPMIWDNFSIFRTNCAITCGTRACNLRGLFADVAQRKWRLRFTKSFMLLAHNSTRLCLLEFGLSIFVVSCSSLSEVRQCRI